MGWIILSIIEQLSSFRGSATLGLESVLCTEVSLIQSDPYRRFHSSIEYMCIWRFNLKTQCLG